MIKEYILSFSSFYKAAYAQDMLEHEGIHATLKKLPTELVRSCSTGLYLRTSSMEPVYRVLDDKGIICGGVFEISHDADRKRVYTKIK